jgi:hypothetical protein
VQAVSLCLAGKIRPKTTVAFLVKCALWMKVFAEQKAPAGGQARGKRQ